MNIDELRKKLQSDSMILSAFKKNQPNHQENDLFTTQYVINSGEVRSSLSLSLQVYTYVMRMYAFNLLPYLYIQNHLREQKLQLSDASWARARDGKKDVSLLDVLKAAYIYHQLETSTRKTQEAKEEMQEALEQQDLERYRVAELAKDKAIAKGMAVIERYGIETSEED